MLNNRWVLPEGIEEVLPEQARQLEAMRRKLLDMYASWGYDLVMPPFIEYLESLLTGTGHDLDLQTFKITDQLTGRLMGIRADMTPQVARIDAHHLKTNTPTRLCYMGTVLHTRTDGFASSRSPLQVGAELYGHSGAESDVEILLLMVETLKTTGMTDFFVDLGHVGIYRALANQANLNSEQEVQLFDVLQRKAIPELDELLTAWKTDKIAATLLRTLPDLNGDDLVLAEARDCFKKADKSVKVAIENLADIAQQLKARDNKINLHFDLAELRGYNYHTGVVFAAYVPGQGKAVALGGRYDDIGKDFGIARPATGFSTDLKTLFTMNGQAVIPVNGIYAPAENDKTLFTFINTLRKKGERVVMVLPGQKGDAREMGCDRQIIRQADSWKIQTL